MRIDENSLITAYQNRYRCRKKELIELLEYIILRKVYPLEDENQKLKINLLNMIDLLQKSHFYLTTVLDKNLNKHHLEQIETLTTLINKLIGDNNEKL